MGMKTAKHPATRDTMVLYTGTRISRYSVEEFLNLKIKGSRLIAPLASLSMPTILVMITRHDGNGNPIPVRKAIWPIFGSINQVLAGIALIILTIILMMEAVRTFYQNSHSEARL